MLVQPSTPVFGRLTLSPPTKRPPVKEIYAGYARILDSKPARGGKPLPVQLAEQFGVPDWEWTRMKIVYEAYLDGSDYAAELVADIDSGKQTVSGAYRLLNEAAEDDNLAAAMPTIKLRDVAGRLHASQAYYRTVTAALRNNARINRGDMTADDITELTHTLRAHGAALTRLARLLGAATSGGTEDHGRQDRR